MASNELQVPSYVLNRPATTQMTNCSSISTHLNPHIVVNEASLPDGENPEYRLPSINSLIVVMVGNALFQLSFFAIVPSAHRYVEFLGGTSTFSGLIIGIPTVFTGVALPIVKRFDGGQYRRPFVIAYIASVVANIFLALAYMFKVLCFLLLARMIAGIGFTSFMFSRKYCTDPRLVGIRRRTALASWYIFGQAFGISVGPWIGGIFYQLGYGKSSLFNGLTAPGWIIAGVWFVFWVVSGWFFQDVPETSNNTMPGRPAIGDPEMNASELGQVSNIANDQQSTSATGAGLSGAFECLLKDRNGAKGR